MSSNLKRDYIKIIKNMYLKKTYQIVNQKNAEISKSKIPIRY